jgi:hypothetical protein
MRRLESGSVLLLCAVLLGGGEALPAQERTWLPAPVAEGAAQQLADRMRVLGGGGAAADEKRLLSSARKLIGAMAAVVTEWGAEGVLARAPLQSDLGIASAGDPYLDAMALYQVCNLLLVVQFQDPAFQQNANARVTSVFGLSAVSLALLSLREPFLAAGGDEAAIEAHLAGPTLVPVLTAIQKEPGARAAAEAQCQPLIVALLEKPLAQLGGG